MPVDHSSFVRTSATTLVSCALFGARHAVQSTAQVGWQQLVADMGEEARRPRLTLAFVWNAALLPLRHAPAVGEFPWFGTAEGDVGEVRRGTCRLLKHMAVLRAGEHPAFQNEL